MWKSAKAFGRGVLAHWVQLIGGTAVAVTSFAADAWGWIIPSAVFRWTALGFVGWAILLAYHDLRIRCDSAMDGLRDRMEHQRLSDELTERHGYAVHNFINGKQEVNTLWSLTVGVWYDEVIEIMERHGCTAGEINHVNTIAFTEVRACGGNSESAMLHIRLNRIADIATKHGQLAQDLALAARR